MEISVGMQKDNSSRALCKSGSDIRPGDRRAKNSARAYFWSLGSTGCQPVLFGSLPKSSSNVRYKGFQQHVEVVGKLL